MPAAIAASRLRTRNDIHHGFSVQFKEEMLQSSESETEILLGNKQLLGVFLVVVVLLGIAFAGGYKIGQAAGRKALVSAPPPAAEDSAASSAPASAAASPSSSTGGETHAFPASNAGADQQPESAKAPAVNRGAYHPPAGEDDAPPLGSSGKHAKPAKAPAANAAPVPEPASEASFSPVSGQTFLQVVAAGRDESQAIADVLRKKGFRAHAVPKPGSTKLYRVLIGPMRDSGDLATTRDSLRKTGFREIFIQRY